MSDPNEVLDSDSEQKEQMARALEKLAHDLNNILLPLTMSLELLKNPMDEASRNEILDLLQMSTLRIENTSRQILQLTDPDFELPRTAPPLTTSPPLSELPKARGQQILVIDDEPMVQGVIRHILESHGYVVLTATGGDEGCQLYQLHQERMAAVVVDMLMPLMDGHEIIQRLITCNPKVRIIAISGQAGTMFGPDFLNANVRGFLHKPFTAYTLLKTLDMLVH